jgi:hypothetical protein
MVAEIETVTERKMRLRAEARANREKSMRLQAEARAGLAEIKVVELAVGKMDSEETLAFVLHQYSSTVIEYEDKMAKLLKERDEERAVMAKAAFDCVQKFVPPAPKLDKIVGKPARTTQVEKKLAHQSSQAMVIQNERKIGPLPDSFMVGETYVSGVAGTFGEFGF